MEVLVGILIAILAIVGIVSSRLITTFFHELGHAIPALLFSKGPVRMYVGSHGNPKNTMAIPLGRLQIFLSFNIWELQLGLCTHKSDITFMQALIIILSGPFMSLLTATLILLGMIYMDLSDGWMFFLALFMISAVFDFFINIIPRSLPAKLHDGSEVYNDGRQFINLFRETKLPTSYFYMLNLIREEKYKEASELLAGLIDRNGEKKEYVEALTESYSKSGELDLLISLVDNYAEKEKLSPQTITYWANAKLKKHNYDDVVVLLTKLLFQGKSYYNYYFFRGKALIELSEYKEALIDFNALTLLDEKSDFIALGYRAYCQYRMGYQDEAEEDIMLALGMDHNDSGELYFLAGKIFEDTHPKKALKYFEKSKSSGYQHYALDFNISNLEDS